MCVRGERGRPRYIERTDKLAAPPRHRSPVTWTPFVLPYTACIRRDMHALSICFCRTWLGLERQGLWPPHRLNHGVRVGIRVVDRDGVCDGDLNVVHDCVRDGIREVVRDAVCDGIRDVVRDGVCDAFWDTGYDGVRDVIGDGVLDAVYCLWRCL